MGEEQDSQNPTKKWYKTPWGMLILLVLWPFTLSYYVWKSNITIWAKVLLILVIWIFSFGIVGNYSPENNKKSIQEAYKKGYEEGKAAVLGTNLNPSSPIPMPTSTPVQTPTQSTTPTKKPIPIQESTTSTPISLPTTKFEISGVVVKQESGITIVYGEVKNNDSIKHSLSLKTTFYDASRKILGTAVGAVNDLAAGETKTFTLMGPDEVAGYANTKTQVDASF